MKIIVDTNIIFSALLSKENDSKYFLTSTNHEIFSCNFLFVEIFKHRDKIQELSKLSERDLLLQMDKVLSRINFVNNDAIPTNFYYTAFNLCKNIDENDTPFIALTLFLNGYFMTGDKVIYNGLQDKDIKLISLKEAIKIN